MVCGGVGRRKALAKQEIITTVPKLKNCLRKKNSKLLRQSKIAKTIMFHWSRCLDAVGRGAGNTLGQNMYQRGSSKENNNNYATFSPNIVDDESERKRKLELMEMKRNSREPTEKWILSKSGTVMRKLVPSSRSRHVEAENEKAKKRKSSSQQKSGKRQYKRSRKDIVCGQKQKREADEMETDEYDSYDEEGDSDESCSSDGYSEDSSDDNDSDAMDVDEGRNKTAHPPQTESATALRKQGSAVKKEGHSRRKKDIFE